MKQPARTSTRQPLISRAMKVGLMAEQSAIGNDEPSNRSCRHIVEGVRRISDPRSRTKMTISAHPDYLFGPFQGSGAPPMGTCRSRPCRQRCTPMLAAAAGARPGAFDGTWNVTFTPKAGNCHASNTRALHTSTARAFRPPAAARSPAASPAPGCFTVRITVGASRADGRGRLAGNAGAGRWSGFITGDRCSGVWQATPELGIAQKPARQMI